MFISQPPTSLTSQHCIRQPACPPLARPKPGDTVVGGDRDDVTLPVIFPAASSFTRGNDGK